MSRPLSPERLLLATRSGGKLHELRPLLAAAGFDTVDLAEAGIRETAVEDAIEHFDTFEQNAVAKARYFYTLTGLPTLADDSGLEVTALGGSPGVHSKRWSGRSDLRGQPLDDANNALLLARLAGAADRRARYVCVAALVRDGGDVYTARGEVTGEILERARGAGGFGYDPYFFAPELGGSFGERSREEKERVSHRGRAVRALLSRLLPKR